MGSNSDLRAARRRRIDDARQLQQERRRMAQQQQQPQSSIPQQQQQVIYEMNDSYDDGGGGLGGGYHSDTMTSSSFSGGGSTRGSTTYANNKNVISPARSNASSTRSKLSAKRKSMMQRRIEMKRRMEEEEERRKQEENDRGFHRQQSAATTVHSNSHRGGQQQQSNNDMAVSNNNSYHRPQHYQQQQQAHQQPGGVNYHGQSMPRNNSAGSLQNLHSQGSYHNNVAPNYQQQRQQYQPNVHPNRNQQQLNYDHNRAHQLQQPNNMRHPSQNQQQYYQPQQPSNAPSYNIHQQHQQNHTTQYQQQQYVQQHNPISPPMLQRKELQQHQHPSQYNNNNNAQQQVTYNMGEDLEKSSIIRNNRFGRPNHQRQRSISSGSRGSRQRIMNRNDMAPSDEWNNGYNSDNGGRRQQQGMSRGRSQQPLYHYQQPSQPQHQPQRRSRSQSSQRSGRMSNQLQQPHLGQGQYNNNGQQSQRQPTRIPQTQQPHPAVVSHFMSNHPSMQGGNNRSRYQEEDLVTPQKNPPPQQYHNHNQPNWNEVNELHRDTNQQRHYQQRHESRQTYQQEQTHQKVQLQQQEERQRNNVTSKSPQRPPHISTISTPVEHLGVRSDQIQRKNNQNLEEVRREHHPPTNNDSYTIEGEGSIVSVSEHARKLEKQGQRIPQGGHHPQQDDETISVSSLRKGWEKKEHNQQQQQQGKHDPSPNRHHPEAYDIWTERSNRLTQRRHREQRREQKKSIEERWRSNFRHNSTVVKNLPPNAKNVGYDEYHGYQSEGSGDRGRRRHRNSGDGEGGYQSEGQELVRNRNRAPPPNVNESMEIQGQEEIEFDPDTMLLDDNIPVDSLPDAITPQDARRRLWDQKERLRTVLPKDDFECGDVRDRWVEHTTDHQDGSLARSTYTASTGGQSRFKSKFVRAAAVASQKHGESHSPQRSQKHTQQQHYQQQHHQLSYKKNYDTKASMGVLSHYTDSTAETTTLDTHLAESFGSSPRYDNPMTMNNNATVRKVTPSPPRRRPQQRPHLGPSTGMPPIAEQRASTMVSPSRSQGAHTANTTSVASLIERINAVSRSNPADALAAIDSIIKKEGAGVVGSGNTVPAQMLQQVSRSNSGRSAGLETKRYANLTSSQEPPIVNKARDKNLRMGKEFFQQKYEEVLHTDSLQVIRDANADIVHDRPSFDENDHHGDPEDEYDDDDLSSDDTTVSSMTNPTYQGDHRVQITRASSQEPPQDIEEKKSWNTLKREYNVRKSSPPQQNYSHEEGEQHVNKPPSDENIGLDQFSPKLTDDEENDWQQSKPWGPQNTLSDEQPVHTGGPPPLLQRERTADTTRNDQSTAHSSKPWDEKRKPNMKTQVSHSRRNRDLDVIAGARAAKEELASNMPKLSMTVPQKRASTPEHMMAVSNAFSDVDISFEATSRSSQVHHSRPIHSPAYDNEDPPLQTVVSSKSEQSLQAASEAFSDANTDDIFARHEMSVTQKKQEFEDLARSWSGKSGTNIGSSSSSSFHRSPHLSMDSAVATTKKKPANKKWQAATDWARESSADKPKGTKLFGKKKKLQEPKLRLKGSKSLTSKFASLVKAFDDIPTEYPT